MIKTLLKWTVALSTLLITMDDSYAQIHRCGFDDKHEHRLKTDIQYKNKIEKIENEWLEYVQNDNNPKKMIISGTDTTFEIPIVVHIIHTGGAIGSIYNPTDTRIIEWVEYTNQVLAGTAPGYVSDGDGGADLKIRLVLARRTPDCDSTNGILRVNGSVIPGYAANGVGTPGVDEDLVFALSRWDASNYYNVYVVNKIDGNDGTSGSFTAGYAYLPPALPTYDGSVMLATIAEAGESTFAHEMGHALGLYHTFQESTMYTTGGTCGPVESHLSCVTLGDKICDTEYSRGAFDLWPCPTSSDINPCTGTYYQGVQYNVMNYTNCPNRFTPGQRDRAKYMLLLHRATLLESNGLLYPPAEPMPTVVSACAPDTISDVSNTSAGGPTRVRLESIDNTSQPYRNYLTNFYEDFTQSMCIRTNSYTDLIKGETYTLLVDLFLNVQHVSVFFDFDGDGIFNTTTEKVYVAWLAPGTRSITFTVPMDAVEMTYVRMRIKSELGGGTADLPCTNLVKGQVEDYAVRFLIEPLNMNTNSLKAESNQCSVVLNWSVSDSHLPIETLELERSTNGQDFTTIEHFTIGKNEDVRTYTDNSANAGEYFYRLKIKNVADKVSYTKVAKVSHNCQNGFSIFPNPTNGKLNVQFIAETNETSVIDIYDFVGKHIAQFKVDCMKGLNQHEIDMSQLSNGLYIIKLTHNNKTNFSKVNVLK